jgi:hypothetical protein
MKNEELRIIPWAVLLKDFFSTSCNLLDFLYPINSNCCIFAALLVNLDVYKT